MLNILHFYSFFALFHHESEEIMCNTLIIIFQKIFNESKT